MPGMYTVATVFGFIKYYRISIAPLVWLILSETFPTRHRAMGQSAGTLAVWVTTHPSNQFLGPTMSYFASTFGSVGPAFWIFAAVCAFTLLFGWFMVPETKLWILEQIAGW
jgi:hypothetical protein